MNNGKLQDIMSALNIDNYDIQKVKSGVYLLENQQDKYIVKVLNNKGIRKKISNFRTGKVARFETEIKVYEFLENNSFEFFHHPKLKKTDNKTYIVNEYINGIDGWDKREINRKNLIACLLEFQLLKLNIKKNVFKKIANSFHKKIPNKMIVWSIKLIDSPSDVIKWLTFIWIVFKDISFLKGGKESLLTHNDLFRFNNMISTYEGYLYIYDYEYVKVENKWFLIDIYDISFDLEKLVLNVELFREYIEQLSNVIAINKCIYYVEKQTRTILLRKSLGVLADKNISLCIKSRNQEFIKGILLNEKEYKKWYTFNIVPICNDLKNE